MPFLVYQVCSPYETYMCLNNTIAASQRASAQPIVNSVDKVADTGSVDAEAAAGGTAANNATNGLIGVIPKMIQSGNVPAL